jgi:glycosyltransferase involved in cell wall biosynthesis
MKERILVIHHGKGIGGGLIALVGLLEELKAEYEVTVFSIFDGEAVGYLKKNSIDVLLPRSLFYKKMYYLFVHSEASYFNIINFLYDIYSFFIFFLSKYFFAQRELKIVENGYDYIYLNSTFISDWALSAKKFNKKVIIHVREPISIGLLGFRRSIIRNSIRKSCDKIIAISYDNAMRINLQHKTSVVYDPVVVKNRISADGIQKEDFLKYFVYVGGYTRIKGFEQLVNSIPFLNPEIRIFFLGGEVFYNPRLFKRILRTIFDPYFKKQLRLSLKLKKSNKIINIGLTENVFNYFESSIALISPFSKPHASLPILEAFSVGRPVIVSNIEGMDEIVTVNNGFFFENNDSISLALNINKMADLDVKEYEKLKQGSLSTYLNIMKRKETVLSEIRNI